MKLATQPATRQINRLCGLPRFGELGKDGVAEMVRVLREHADNENHAERAVTEWIDHNKWLPSCAELIEVLEQTLSKPAKIKPNWDCEHCKGSAYERTWLLVTYVRHPSGEKKSTEETEITPEMAAELSQTVDNHFQKVVDAVKYCRCSFGQQIKELRRLRQAEEAQKGKR